MKWNIDLYNCTAEHESGFLIKKEHSSDGFNWKVIAGSLDTELLSEGEKWYLHFYSKMFISKALSQYRLNLNELAEITQYHLDNKGNDLYDFSRVTAEDLNMYLTDEEPLFPIALCSLIRKALYFHQQDTT